MPIHEYLCPDCGARFERLVRTTDAAPECPSCGSTGPNRLMSVIAGLGSNGGAPAAAGCGCGGACACGR